MLYKRGDKIIIRVDPKYDIEFEVESTVLSYNKINNGYAVDPIPLGKRGWLMFGHRLESYPEAITDERAWFVGSDCVIGLAYAIVVIDTVD